MLVHNVVDGPFEMIGEDPWLVCLVEERGKMFHEEVSFNTLDDCYKFKGHFTVSIEPIELTEEDK